VLAVFLSAVVALTGCGSRNDVNLSDRQDGTMTKAVRLPDTRPTPIKIPIPRGATGRPLSAYSALRALPCTILLRLR